MLYTIKYTNIKQVLEAKLRYMVINNHRNINYLKNL